MSVTIVCVVGARPNFIKMAAIMRSLAADRLFTPHLVHTGQHYDVALSQVFFDQLAIPAPDTELSVGAASAAVQTAEIMRRFEPVLEREQPHAVLVVGDVNTTLACALVAAKFRRREPFAWRGGRRSRPVVVHVEAGLRSFDDDMPEEVNRRLADAVSDLLFVSEPAGLDHLRREGVPDHKVFFVGNVMIDTLYAVREQAAHSPILEQLGLTPREFALLTLHRPSNVDEPAGLAELLRVLDEEVAAHLPIVFPIHPRTRARLTTLDRLRPPRWVLSEPIGYLDFLRLQSEARLVLTDSGGIQEETTVLGVPCVTLRENTERPVTVAEGTNVLAGTTRAGIAAAVRSALDAARASRTPRLWDGHAAERVVKILADQFRVR